MGSSATFGTLTHFVSTLGEQKTIAVEAVLVVVVCSNCESEVLHADNGSVMTFVARLPCNITDCARKDSDVEPAFTGVVAAAGRKQRRRP